MISNHLSLDEAQISKTYVNILLEHMRNRAMADTDIFLSQLNVDKDSLIDDEGLMPMSKFVMILEEAAKYIGDENLGLHYYQHVDFRRLGIFGYVLLNSTTIGEALYFSSRYYCLFQQGMEYNLVVEDDIATLTYNITTKNCPKSRQDAEMTLMGAVTLIRFLYDGLWQPSAVHFSHEAPDDTSEHTKLLGSSVHFNKSFNCLFFEKKLLNAPVHNIDIQLKKSLTITMEQLLSINQEQLEEDWFHPFQEKIINSLENGVPKIDDIADKMYVSKRTLQRKLSNEGLSFLSVIESIRYKLASNYLSASEVLPQDIAIFLGYSDVSSFSRAFKRWTNMTPLEFRKKHRITPK
ncbi:MAG: AraC family transcriptional regulator [Paraglaciecola sp.]|uniref:AraC family transcriptional regulator n=1 Tax=Paraglaciecola sp. TaxID=1920173 RepID=UPI0032637A27